MQKTLEQKLGDYFNQKLRATNPEEEKTKKVEGPRKSIFQEVKEKSVFAFNFKKKEPTPSLAIIIEKEKDQMRGLASVLDPHSEDNKKINERALAKDIEDINRLKKIEESD